MGRKKSIDQNHIFDAAEAVVARGWRDPPDVGRRCPGSRYHKGSVVYDYGTKQALIEAMVELAVLRDNAFNEAAAAPFTGSDNATLKGRIVS